MALLPATSHFTPSHSFWLSSEIVPLEFKGQWNALTDYKEGDVVYTPADPTLGNNFMMYLSNIDGNVGNVPQLSPTDWTPLSPNGMSFNGQYDAAKTYSIGDVIYTPVDTAFGKNEMAYVSLTNLNSGNQPQTSSTNWSPLSPKALCYNTTWDATTTYSKGDIVTGDSNGYTAGMAYVSIVDNNLNNVPQTSNSAWSVFSPSAVSTQGQWDNTTTYARGDLVYQLYSSAGGNGMGYVSTTDGNVGNNPAVDSVNWTPVAPNGLNIQPQSVNLGNWVSGNRYLPNAVVFYKTPNASGNSGSYYVCITDTLGNETVPPILASTSRTYWLPLDSSTFVGTYSASARYDRDNTVSYQGSVYQSATDNNINNQPLINPSSWISLGYKALRIPYAATFVSNVTPTTNVPFLIKTIPLGSLGNYNYAQGFGCAFITQPSGSFGALAQIRFYLSESATGTPAPSGASSSNIGIIFTNISGTTLNNTFADLSRVSYCNLANPFTTLYLFCIVNFTGSAGTITITGGGQQAGMGSTFGGVLGNLANVSGLEVWKAPVSAAI
jgi:hypothetical protein